MAEGAQGGPALQVWANGRLGTLLEAQAERCGRSCNTLAEQPGTCLQWASPTPGSCVEELGSGRQQKHGLCCMTRGGGPNGQGAAVQEEGLLYGWHCRIARGGVPVGQGAI